MSRLVGGAAAGAAALAVHAALNAVLLRRPPRGATVDAKVSVLIPARNEEGRVGSCVTAVLASGGVADLEVLVLDDESTDGTADAARAAGARVLRGEPLPAGWLGKPWACAQLAGAASGEILVFVDADVTLAPDAVAATAAMVTAMPNALVSPYPRQIVASGGERLVQPLLQWSWLSFLPLRLAERPALVSMTAANGQLLGCRAVDYRAAGGHDAVRDAVVEDVWLARAFKRTGRPVVLADGTDIATCRMYEGWANVRDGYGKSLWAAFGSPVGAAAVSALLGWLYLVPPAAALAGRGRVRRLGLLGYGAGVAGRLVAARRTGGRVGDAAAHPLSIVVLVALTADSFRRHAAGTLAWKGRALGG